MSSIRGQFAGLALSRAVGSVLQAVALIILARSVPPAVFGSVNAVIGVVGVVLVVTGLGLSIYVPLARGAADHDQVAAAIRLNTWSNLATAAILVPALLVWTDVQELHRAVVVIGLSLALERNVDTVLGVPVADGNTHVTAVSLFLRRMVTLSVMIPGIRLGMDPVWSYTLGLLVGAVAAQVHVRAVVRVNGRASKELLATVLRRSWPFLLSNVAGQARTLDTAVVASVVGPSTAGLYAAASKLVQPLQLIPQTLAGVVTPRAVRMSPTEVRRLGSRVVVASLWSALLVVPTALFGEEALTILLGADYAAAAPALTWSVAGLPFVVLAAALGSLLQGQGRQRLVAFNGLVFAVLQLAGAGVGAVLAGATGAAMGLTLASMLRSVVLGWSLSRLR